MFRVSSDFLQTFFRLIHTFSRLSPDFLQTFFNFMQWGQGSPFSPGDGSNFSQRCQAHLYVLLLIGWGFGSANHSKRHIWADFRLAKYVMLWLTRTYLHACTPKPLRWVWAITKSYPYLISPFDETTEKHVFCLKRGYIRKIDQIRKGRETLLHGVYGSTVKNLTLTFGSKIFSWLPNIYWDSQKKFGRKTQC